MTVGRPPSTMSGLRKRLEHYLGLSHAYFPCTDRARRRRQVTDRIEADGPGYLILVHPGGNVAWEGRRRSLFRALTDGGFALSTSSAQAVARIAFEDVKSRLPVEYGFHPELDWWMVLRLPDAHRRWLREQAPPDHRDELVPAHSDRRTAVYGPVRDLLAALGEIDPDETDLNGSGPDGVTAGEGGS